MNNRTESWIKSITSKETPFVEHINTELILEVLKEELRIKDYENTINLMKNFLEEVHTSLKTSKRPFTVQNCNDTLSNHFYNPNANEFTTQGTEPNRSLPGHWTNEWVKFNKASVETKLASYDHMHRIFTSLANPADNFDDYLDKVVSEVSAIRLSFTSTNNSTYQT